MVNRNIVPSVIAAIKDTPVVLLIGGRQTGKSTLAQTLVEQNIFAGRYLTFDDATLLSAAHNNPTAFIAGIESPVVLDEVQRVPQLFLAIKAAIDKKRTPGRFILTGSTNVLLLPRVADSLAGRMEVQILWPFSQGEVQGTVETFIDRVFLRRKIGEFSSKESKTSLVHRVAQGGFPEIRQRDTPARRDAWFGSYITTILQRDVRDLAHIEGLSTLPRILGLLAARAGSLLNFADISNSAAIPQTTLKRYVTLLETTFLIRFLPAWSNNKSKRFLKTPKVMFCDTGLMGHLLGMDEVALLRDTDVQGHFLENFVAMELVKQATWSSTKPSLFHFRTQPGYEVDVVMERADGSIVGVEVKASSTISVNDLKGLKALSQIAGKKFLRGVALYGGTEAVTFENDIVALPISFLWQ